MSDQDPTRRQEPVPSGTSPHEPTSVIRTTETAEPGRRPVAPRGPGGGGVGVGLAVAAALLVGLIGLFAGIVLFGGDDDDGAEDLTAVEDTVAPEADTSEIAAERDQLAQQVEDLQAEVTDLQSQLDSVTQERDDIRAQLEAAEGDEGDQIETVPAPDVVGGSVADAESVASSNGWILVERTVESGPGNAEPGSIVAQYPEPGAEMIEGSVLVVDVLQQGGDGE